MQQRRPPVRRPRFIPPTPGSPLQPLGYSAQEAPQIQHSPNGQQAQQAFDYPHLQQYSPFPRPHLTQNVAYPVAPRPPDQPETNTSGVPWRSPDSLQPTYPGTVGSATPGMPRKELSLVYDRQPRRQTTEEQIAYTLAPGKRLNVINEREHGYLELISVAIDSKFAQFEFTMDSKPHTFTPERLAFLGYGAVPVNGHWLLIIAEELPPARFNLVYNPTPMEEYMDNITLNILNPKALNEDLNVYEYITRRYVVDDFLEGPGGE